MLQNFISLTWCASSLETLLTNSLASLIMQFMDKWCCPHRNIPQLSQSNNDICSFTLTGIGHSNIPEVRLFGYTRDPASYPAVTQYHPPARFPQWTGPGYYGYYHENLDLHASGRYRDLPAIRRYPGYPIISKITGN
jgi:hypothetical protein